MAAALDSKSSVRKGRVGSTPSLGTRSIITVTARYSKTSRRRNPRAILPRCAISDAPRHCGTYECRHWNDALFRTAFGLPHQRANFLRFVLRGLRAPAL